MMRRGFRQGAQLVFIAAALAASRAVAAGPWNALFVFGDSYSDSGAGYVDGNGPTAVVYLARGLGIPFTYATDPDRAGKSLNFAVSGARTGGGDGYEISCPSRRASCLLGRGLQTQVLDFLRRTRAGEIKFAPDQTLFFIACGLNDRHLATNETTDNLYRALALLASSGARHFAIALLPVRIPSFQAVGQRLDPALRELVAEPRLSQWDVRLSRWGEYFDAVMDHPDHYGITNTTDACAGRAVFDEDPSPKGDPAKFYFYHEGHPSTRVHQVVGELLVREAREREQ